MLKELLMKLDKGRQELKAEWDALPKKKGDDGTDIVDVSAEKMAELKKRNDELNELSEKVATLRGVDAHLKAAMQDNTPVNRSEMKGGMNFQTKSLGDQFMEAKSGVRDFEFDADMDVEEMKAFLGLESKATMTTSANGYPPEVLRDGNLVYSIQRPIQLLDFLRVEPTSQNALKWMAETVFTDVAVEKAEAAALAEATLTYAEQTDSIRKIGAYIPVTEEQLEDEPGIKAIIENRLGFMVRRRLDTQVTVGNGTAPNLRGIYNATSVQTQAQGADADTLTIPDVILSAMSNVEVNGRAIPNVIVLHSLDVVKLTKTKTADGQYLADVLMNGMIPRIWGLPIVKSDALAQGTGLVLDSNYFIVKLRRGLEVATGFQNDDFIKNQFTVRAHLRAGLERLRDQAACRITGIA